MFVEFDDLVKVSDLSAKKWKYKIRMAAMVREKNSPEPVPEELLLECGRPCAAIKRLSVAEEVLPFPVRPGCSGTFTPVTVYAGNLGTSPFLPSPLLADMRRDITKPGLFGGLCCGRKKHFAHWQSSSDSDPALWVWGCGGTSSLEDTAKGPVSLWVSCITVWNLKSKPVFFLTQLPSAASAGAWFFRRLVSLRCMFIWIRL